MDPFTQVTAIACPLPRANVDTDQLIPARFMKESRDQGYGRFLLHDLRFNAKGEVEESFILNHSVAEAAKIFVARRNFGAGSSREAAVYALVDYGFRCIIAPSFGDIFSANAINNGLLPAVVNEDDCEALLSALNNAPGEMTVNLETQTIHIGQLNIGFDISETSKVKLLNGWDDIDMTLSHSDAIESFQHLYHNKFPWTAP